MGEDHHGTKIGHAEHHRINRGAHGSSLVSKGGAQGPASQPHGHGGEGSKIGHAEHHRISGSREVHCFPGRRK